MKKIKFILVFISILLATSPYKTLASYSDEQRIFDYSDLFTAEEEEHLEELSSTIGAQVQTDILIVTIDDAKGKTSMEYADDFYDEGAYGYEESYGTGVFLLIDMDNREAWISTSGDAIDHFSERRIDATLDDIFIYLPEGDYYNSALSFMENVEYYMESLPSSSNGNEYNPDAYSDTDFYYDNQKKESILKNPWICLGIAVAIGGVIVLIMISSAKSKMTAGGRSYVEPGSFSINSRRDTFLRTSTITRKIETNKSSGGGSSGGGRHTSSSGRSHGGGGRKF